ncbi:hypothetical protein LHFGNBLO_005674 [Mesorhizobium sp. AR10]|uniref:hypothetical protein n=1 Tax=Mesorhizobium sp. AR10 TaxID=2865839 RepID=UPI0021606D9C|nr:hypothetical protein [Mesorhizobium sp. AR10]UVK38504.1 hypothetical protein LHFGNBLO_005674 [Mesorhizobium sp. AR10]
MRLISIMVELGAIVAGAGLETEQRCRDLAVMVTGSITDPFEALRLQEELACQFSLLSYGGGFGLELAQYWDETLELVDLIRCASILH